LHFASHMGHDLRVGFLTGVYARSVGDCLSRSKPTGWHQGREHCVIAAGRAVWREVDRFFAVPIELSSRTL
jgi:hypothetical protein